MSLKNWFQKKKYKLSLIKKLKQSILTCDVLERVVCLLASSKNKDSLPYKMKMKVIYKNSEEFICDFTFVVDELNISVINTGTFLDTHIKYTDSTLSTVNRNLLFRGSISYESLDPQYAVGQRSSVDMLEDIISNVLLHCIRRG